VQEGRESKRKLLRRKFVGSETWFQVINGKTNRKGFNLKAPIRERQYSYRVSFTWFGIETTDKQSTENQK